MDHVRSFYPNHPPLRFIRDGAELRENRLPFYAKHFCLEVIQQPIEPCCFGIRFHGSTAFYLRPTSTTLPYKVWPPESYIDFQEAYDRTSQELRDIGWFWFSQTFEEFSLAISTWRIIVLSTRPNKNRQR
jgi:hypothetical protein